MAAKKKEQVKQVEPVKKAEQKPEQEPQPTTIKLKPEVKTKLDELSGMLKTPDYNTTVARIIEFIPERLSSEDTVTLVIPAQKFEWLKAKQCCTDATNLLIASVR